MAKVYTGKVIIPGDKLDEFFKVMQEPKRKGSHSDSHY